MSVEGKVCLVTGATSGHGLAVARALARQGAELIIHGRSEEKCQRVATELAALGGGRRPQILLADLCRKVEVERLSEELRALGRPLHLLVNNAGGVFKRRTVSPDGVEMTLAVNYLATFQLTLRLVPLLVESAPSRVVNVASDAHRIVSLDLGNLQLEWGYNFMRAYSLSKLCLIYFTIELARRLEGTGVTVNSVDPGPVRSNIGQNNEGLAAPLLRLLMDRFFPPAEVACQTTLYVATAPPLEQVSGRYFRFMAERVPRLDRQDATLGERLWRVSAELTGADLRLS